LPLLRTLSMSSRHNLSSSTVCTLFSRSIVVGMYCVEYIESQKRKFGLVVADNIAEPSVNLVELRPHFKAYDGDSLGLVGMLQVNMMADRKVVDRSTIVQHILVCKKSVFVNGDLIFQPGQSPPCYYIDDADCMNVHIFNSPYDTGDKLGLMYAMKSKVTSASSSWRGAPPLAEVRACDNFRSCCIWASVLPTKFLE
jgi:hypothetical protein